MTASTGDDSRRLGCLLVGGAWALIIAVFVTAGALKAAHRAAEAAAYSAPAPSPVYDGPQPTAVGEITSTCQDAWYDGSQGFNNVGVDLDTVTISTDNDFITAVYNLNAIHEATAPLAWTDIADVQAASDPFEFQLKLATPGSEQRYLELETSYRMGSVRQRENHNRLVFGGDVEVDGKMVTVRYPISVLKDRPAGADHWTAWVFMSNKSDWCPGRGDGTDDKVNYLLSTF